MQQPQRDALLNDLPRGDPARPPHLYTPPNSQFMPTSGIMATEELTWRPGKLFLGVVGGTMQADEAGRPVVSGGHPVGMLDDRHICTFAGSRAGKGRSAIVPNMLHYPGSVLATDPKGELATMTARRRVELGQKVHVLDPFGVASGVAASLRSGFNPITAMRSATLLEDAALVADALVMVTGKDPHWDESARAFIEGVILHVRTWPEFEKQQSLLTVRELVGKADDKLQTDMQDNDDPDTHGAVQTAAADFFQRPNNERGSVLSSARRHLKFLDLFRGGIARHAIEHHGFNLDALKTEPTTIYLCLPARHIGTCARWLRLFVNLTLQAMEKNRKPPPAGVPVLFALDEFAALGHLRQIEDAAAQIAGFGVKLWPVLQDMGQLKALYEARWETFLGNAGVLQFFGNNDLTTLDWINRRCGRTSIKMGARNDVPAEQLKSGASGRSQHNEVHDLLTPDEAAKFFGRHDPQLRQLVIWAGEKGPLLVLQRAYYDRHSLFRDSQGNPLFDPPP